MFYDSIDITSGPMNVTRARSHSATPRPSSVFVLHLTEVSLSGAVMHALFALWVLFLRGHLLGCPCWPQIHASRDPPASSAETLGVGHHSCLGLHYF